MGGLRGRALSKVKSIDLAKMPRQTFVCMTQAPRTSDTDGTQHHLVFAVIQPLLLIGKTL